MLNIFNGKNTKEERSNDLQLMQAYNEALEEQKQAEINFNHADSQYIDVAIYQLSAAQEKMNVIIKQIKKEGIYYEKLAIDV